jgi:hypothetical protein
LIVYGFAAEPQKQHRFLPALPQGNFAWAGSKTVLKRYI